MPQHTYEIEIKSLLGSEDKATDLVKKMKQKDTKLCKISKNKQLNHYFVGGDSDKLIESLAVHVPEESHDRLTHILKDGQNISIRTRQLDENVLFIVKASIDDTTSSNGTARIEYEEPVADLTLDQLDQILLKCDCKYQAKWSRERQEYRYKDMNVCIDRNAGYGYLAEFEKVIEDESSADNEKENIRSLMAELEIEELPQERLERMFDFYNNNWRDYYGTDKIFVIE